MKSQLEIITLKQATEVVSVNNCYIVFIEGAGDDLEQFVPVELCRMRIGTTELLFARAMRLVNEMTPLNDPL
jgi:hypothetical protein